MADMVDALQRSEFQLGTLDSNLPFLALGHVGAGGVEAVDVPIGESDELARYSVSQVSAWAGLPLWIGQFDGIGAVVWGEQMRFDSPDSDSFEVDASALGVGWARQLGDRWQVATFVAALQYRSTLPRSQSSDQAMAGVFGRRLVSARHWWAMGLFYEGDSQRQWLLPYLGAVWAPDERWTFSGILPWPGIAYSPSASSFIRFGASPGGTHWRVDGPEDVAQFTEVGGIDITLSLEHRVFGPLWASFEAGASIMRSLKVSRGDRLGREASLGEAFGVRLSLNLRPE